MEGVLVSAKKAGSTMTVTVVSDAQGRYRFPITKIEPGRYVLSIRAAGYELGGPETVDLTSQKDASVDLKLRGTRDLSAQLTNAEWMASVPGTDQQKDVLRTCVGCHKLQYPVRSKYTADAWAPVLARMATYAQQSTFQHPQKRLADRDRELIGEERARLQRTQAEWLASINLSEAPEWNYALKTFPRPKGQGTRVVITEYDLPRPTIEPHDVAVAPDGMVWFSSFGEQNVGTLDPKTGKVTEYPIPELKHGSPTGSLSLRFDRSGNVWTALTYQAGIARVDRMTGQVRVWAVPPTLNRANTQINMTSPEHSFVDGKVWMQDNGFAGIHRLDVATGGWETFDPFKDVPGTHNLYDIVSDSQNNAYITDFQQDAIGRIDAKTGEVTFYHTPTKQSAPRRGTMDAQDRFWFGEYRGDKVGMFDTRTEHFQEWALPTPWSAPYDAMLDKNGDVWTGSMLSDRVSRIDTKTGRVIEYLLPKSTNIRWVFVDNTTTPVTFWVGSNHGASIIRLEPLDTAGAEER